MILLECPDCGGVDFAEDFKCRRCSALRALGKETSLSPRILLLAKKSVASVNRRKPALSAKAKVFLSVACCVLICALCLTISAIQTANGKTLKSITEQLIAQNDANKFAVEKDENQNLTMITLTQENVELKNESKESINVKLLFDCAIEGETLEKTPDEFEITILSNNQKSQNLQFGKLTFQTGEEIFSLDKQDWENWQNSSKSLEYVSYRISRNNLMKIAAAPNTTFQIGDFKSEINFAQQQSIKAFLTAVSVD